MFGLSRLWKAAGALADTLSEINTRLRQECRLDAPAHPDLIEGPLPEQAPEPASNGTGKRRKVVAE